MALSTQRAVSDGTLSTLLLSIDYLERSEITVYFNSVPALTGWAWVGTTEKTITFSPAVSNGVEVLVKRTTKTDVPRNSFSAGAQFNATTLDENTRQALHAAQEMQEGSGIRDIFNEINLHGSKITNVGPGINLGDVVTLGQMKDDAIGAGQATSAFTKRYMGTFASAPSSGMVVGTLYYDSTLLGLYVYDGAGWSAAGSSVATAYAAVGDGIALVYSLPRRPRSAADAQVFVSGVYQMKGTYTIANTTLTFSEAPPSGAALEVVIN